MIRCSELHKIREHVVEIRSGCPACEAVERPSLTLPFSDRMPAHMGQGTNADMTHIEVFRFPEA